MQEISKRETMDKETSKHQRHFVCCASFHFLTIRLSSNQMNYHSISKCQEDRVHTVQICVFVCVLLWECVCVCETEAQYILWVLLSNASSVQAIILLIDSFSLNTLLSVLVVVSPPPSSLLLVSVVLLIFCLTLSWSCHCYISLLFTIFKNK